MVRPRRGRGEAECSRRGARRPARKRASRMMLAVLATTKRREEQVDGARTKGKVEGGLTTETESGDLTGADGGRAPTAETDGERVAITNVDGGQAQKAEEATTKKYKRQLEWLRDRFPWGERGDGYQAAGGETLSHRCRHVAFCQSTQHLSYRSANDGIFACTKQQPFRPSRHARRLPPGSAMEERQDLFFVNT